MKKNKIISFLIFFLVALPALTNATIKLSALFADHMVLQQKTTVPVWGWASPGKEIVIEASWQKNKIHTKADQTGNWKIELQTPKAGGPYKIKITGENSIEIDDVLIGEVWLCSGQSNMTFPLKYNDSAKQEIAKADYPSIRYFAVQHQYGTKPFKDCQGEWQITSPETAASFSAVAYFFAKEIQAKLKVPIGIVCSGWGGTPAEAWTSKNVLQNDESLQYFLQRWKEIPQKVGADSIKYHLELQKWKAQKTPGKQLHKPDEPRTYYYYSKPWCEPAALFNGMIHPLVPFCFKGILWYQGESNVSEANKYQDLFTALIKSWRGHWDKEGKQNVFPFYFVQIAPFGYGDLNDAAKLRQAQYDVMKTVDHTSMAVTIDLGNMNNIHFKHKREVGERLALIAFAKSYGYKNIIYKGPVCIKVSKANNKIKLDFGQSLFTIDKEKPRGFEIGFKNPGSDSMEFVKAQSAVINGTQAIVWSEEVKDPLAVRYAWVDAGGANLINKTGLPAFPFEKKIDSGTK
ncbi:sialate O-acetylesterase [Ginsengibacter hankyongi]|uniref:Sialate O-acetylesterase n=1 Tax=Ginsengibacter hankyongi TaxID=2607284 RepID=A0A5J5IF70_9BACT|nr:sialate O-acetylesterase [Ginsengibacter hankyongi]KAA9038668.1 sialate O-acetylesterase [Ginsengibacter hankyongi]